MRPGRQQGQVDLRVSCLNCAHWPTESQVRAASQTGLCDPMCQTQRQKDCSHKPYLGSRDPSFNLLLAFKANYRTTLNRKEFVSCLLHPLLRTGEEPKAPRNMDRTIGIALSHPEGSAYAVGGDRVT
jgi:hypothetical protein